MYATCVLFKRLCVNADCQRRVGMVTSSWKVVKYSKSLRHNFQLRGIPTDGKGDTGFDAA